ncbi:protein VASCULATURE COMPLEXITY AND CONNECTIVITY-like [Apium graveolens]|uniref:protein VASCULATURE COMPLEXITY AND CONNECTIVITY-like n=1 Tax=Apium graveolens TaxID=4045 RepID=UPI003D7B3AB9
MAKIVGIFVCLFIIALDITAGILGIQAEAAQNQEKHLRLWIFECKQPSHEAFQLGLAAAILLSVAHVIANLLGGCSVGTRDELEKASPTRQLSVACLIFTWIILAVGLAMLVIGTSSNRKSRASCGFTEHHFLSIGGILCIVHGMFSVAYYATASTAFTD